MRIAVLSFTGRGAGVNKRLCEELAKPERIRRPEEPEESEDSQEVPPAV